MSEIAVRLGSRRVARGLSREQLADQTGLPRDVITDLERGKSSGIEFSALARLCDALDCTPNDLLELAESAHVAPMLGGPDEDEIIAERMAEAEAEIDALLADPALAALVLTPPITRGGGEQRETASRAFVGQASSSSTARGAVEMTIGNGADAPILSEKQPVATGAIEGERRQR
jgi:putative transcriptional regulator